MILINKIFSCKVAINDYSLLMTRKIDDLILETTKNYYEKRNYKSSFIVNVLRIVKRSNVSAIDNGVYIEFEADIKYR